MNPSDITRRAETDMAAAVAHFQDELKTLRTGRASVGMLDGVTVEVYGTSMPLNQVATVSTPEAQLIQITPYDPSNIQAIASAIRDNPTLGLNPSDDGRVVRLQIPPLTEERRREIAKQLGVKVEDAMIRLRNIRHDTLDAVDKAKKDKQIGEDDAKRLEKAVDDELNKSRAAIEAASKAKEAEIMTV